MMCVVICMIVVFLIIGMLGVWVFDGNHAHILLQYNPADSISRIVSVLKQCSTWYAWRDYDSFLR